MSDIKEVIKGVKAKLRMFPQAPALMLSVMEISSFITTIESQKEEIEEYKERYTDSQFHVKALADIEAVHIAEIGSLKAITELAVKGLEHLISFPYIAEFVDVDEIAKSTLSEIERLQNG